MSLDSSLFQLLLQTIIRSYNPVAPGFDSQYRKPEIGSSMNTSPNQSTSTKIKRYPGMVNLRRHGRSCRYGKKVRDESEGEASNYPRQSNEV